MFSQCAADLGVIDAKDSDFSFNEFAVSGRLPVHVLKSERVNDVKAELPDVVQDACNVGFLRRYTAKRGKFLSYDGDGAGMVKQESGTFVGGGKLVRAAVTTIRRT